MPQPWFKQEGTKKVLRRRLHYAFEAFATGTSVTLPVGLQDAIMTEDFDFDKCLTRFGLDCKKATAKLNSRKQPRPRPTWECNQSTAREKKVFKYQGDLYQDVTNFCDNYDGLNNRNSHARAKLLSIEFPKSTYLVIPGHSKDNYERIPAKWKNGTQDLGVLKRKSGKPYLLEKRTRGVPTGKHLLLVACKELKRTAVYCKKSARQKQHDRRTIAMSNRYWNKTRQRPTQVLER